jgi:hypothetical protein
MFIAIDYKTNVYFATLPSPHPIAAGVLLVAAARQL